MKNTSMYFVQKPLQTASVFFKTLNSLALFFLYHSLNYSLIKSIYYATEFKYVQK